MTRRLSAALLAATVAGAMPAAQDIPLEYRVKAAYLYHFVKFVEWPAPAGSRFVVCVAGQNPFGTVLADLVRGERSRGVPMETRVILEPDSACHVVFIPRTANLPVYLRAAAGMPTLTVGETPRFLAQGGMIQFFLEGTNVRFEINRAAAERVHLRISARLLQLSRPAEEDER